jgi:hypothetical protein
MLGWLLSMHVIEEEKIMSNDLYNTCEDMNLPYDDGLDGYI